ncbi:MAG: PIN domain-containing protein [Candidatus Thermoplasmatota archaeon]|nr:PIN domain-containing protein [Candidatus Thermoplasmatota archaeon]MDI6856543.1 PIN domain-containing protein [Candidatus Thermoplasmatota archaeon]
MFYVTDTHPLLWYLTDDERLSSSAKEIFDRAEKGEETIIVPTIVLAESFYTTKKYHMDIKFREVLDRLETGWNYQPYPLDLEIIKAIQNLDKLPELHDKIIVATARKLEAKLITKDEKIASAQYVEIVW